MNAIVSKRTDREARRERTADAGQTRRGILVALGLVAALAAVAVSWRLTHAPRREVGRGDYAERSRQLVAEADRVAASVQKRRLADAVVMNLDGLDARRLTETGDVSAATAVEPATMVSTAMTFRVRGVAPRGAHPLAFIDDRTVGIGEAVDGFEVIAIAEESVTFRDPAGRTRSVGVYGE